VLNPQTLTKLAPPTMVATGVDDSEMNMQREGYPYELHWTRHAERYLALVHDALAKNPDDLELQELLQAMEATIAQRNGAVH
jgi:hypothetical protein